MTSSVRLKGMPINCLMMSQTTKMMFLAIWTTTSSTLIWKGKMAKIRLPALVTMAISIPISMSLNLQPMASASKDLIKRWACKRWNAPWMTPCPISKSPTTKKVITSISPMTIWPCRKMILLSCWRPTSQVKSLATLPSINPCWMTYLPAWMRKTIALNSISIWNQALKMKCRVPPSCQRTLFLRNGVR